MSAFIIRMLSGERPVIYGTGDNRISWISFLDVAQFVAASLDHPIARNATMELGGAEGLSPLEVVKIFEKAGGRPFEVTVQRDRSGMRLRGATLKHCDSADILSDGLVPGAIQVPADGGPVVILADGPTTGGYTKIATVIDADLDRVAQAVPGEALRFDAVTVEEAHTASAASSARVVIESRRGVNRCS